MRREVRSLVMTDYTTGFYSAMWTGYILNAADDRAVAKSSLARLSQL